MMKVLACVRVCVRVWARVSIYVCVLGGGGGGGDCVSICFHTGACLRFEGHLNLGKTNAHANILSKYTPFQMCFAV